MVNNAMNEINTIFEKCEKKVRIKKQEGETNIIQFPKRRQDKA